MAEPSERAKQIIAIGDGLFSKRMSMETLWQDIAWHFYPERADFTTIRSPGQEFADHLMTSYPVMLRRDLANSFEAMLRPSGREWFELSTGREEIDEQDDVAAWLDRAKGIVRRAIYQKRAKFARTMKQFDHDFATFGNAVITVEPHPSGTPGVLFQDWHLRDVAWGEGANRDIEIIARRTKMTARGLISLFKDKVADEVKKAAERDPYCEFECYSIVCPAEVWDYSPSGKVETKRAAARRKEAFPWMSLYVDRAHNHVMSEVPIRRNPYVIPRWQLTSQSVYAYSPATICGLPDARLIQSMTRTMLEASEKAVDPPLVAQGEALRGGVQLFAGGITYVDPDYDERTGEALRPLFNTQAFEMPENTYERQLALLKEVFYLNKLTLPETGDMTAYEVSKRVEEYVRAALPLLGPVGDEHAMVVDKTLDIALENRAFGPDDQIPEALRGRDIEVATKSPLQDALDELKATKFQLGLQTVVGPAMQIDPTAAGNVDTRRTVRDSLRGIGWDEDWLVTEDEMDAAEAKANEEAALRKTAEMANAGAATVTNISDAAMAAKQAGIAQ
jgi:hypothetical protein